MNVNLVERHFSRIGARALVKQDVSAFWRVASSLRIDIGEDEGGEFFDIAVNPTALPSLRVVDTQPRLRHLLLMSDQDDGKHKFLCGHDERHWFVAAVPERMSVSSVRTAFEALKPRGVRVELDRRRVKAKKRNRRRNEAFIRQGEWFFVPVAKPAINERLILRNEPIARGGGKPHLCEELVRTGGETVYVCHRYPNGLTERQYRKLLDREPDLRNLHWSHQRRNPQVFVRGRVRHRDHKTIMLHDWHEVLMNTESQAAAMRHVAFID